MAKTYLYLRVSHEDQVASGLGLEAQEKACREFAQAQGLEVSQVFIEAGVSRWVLPSERPAMTQLLAGLRKGDCVIAYRIDRVGDAGPLAVFKHFLNRKGCKLLLALGDNSGSLESLLMAEISAVLASHECRQVSKRTKDAMEAKKARGERWTRRAFGFRVTQAGMMEEDPTEQATIRKMIEWREDGWSLRDIAAELEATGVNPPSGRSWYAKSIAEILRRQAA